MSVIYVLEDDNSIRELVVYTMNSTGFEAVGFSKPSEFWAAMEKETPSLILLDIMLPEEDGLQILKRLRADPSTKKLPVMMLTAKDSEYDKVLGLDSGADDYEMCIRDSLCPGPHLHLQDRRSCNGAEIGLYYRCLLYTSSLGICP